MKHSDYIHKIPIKNSDGRVVGERNVVSFAGLLDLAHADRLSEITTTIAQLPSEANAQTAVVHATVTTAKGKFTGIGDANSRNVHPRIAPHIIRMAETRAIARSLRSALNIGAVCLEKLGDESDVAAPVESQVSNDNAAPTVAPAAAPTPIVRGNGTSSRALQRQPSRDPPCGGVVTHLGRRGATSARRDRDPPRIAVDGVRPRLAPGGSRLGVDVCRR